MSRASRAVAFFVLAACGAGIPSARGAAAPTGDWHAVAAALAAGGSTDFTPHGTQPGLFYRIDAAGSCQSCHGVGGSAPPSAPTFLPYATWSGSMMANATRDPLFFAALDVANHDVPGVGDYCLRCHTSTGWYNGNVVKAGAGRPDHDVARGAAACLLEGRYDYPDSNSDYGGVACHDRHRLLRSARDGEAGERSCMSAWVYDHEITLADPPRRRPAARPSTTTSSPPRRVADLRARRSSTAPCAAPTTTCRHRAVPRLQVLRMQATAGGRTIPAVIRLSVPGSSKRTSMKLRDPVGTATGRTEVLEVASAGCCRPRRSR